MARITLDDLAHSYLAAPAGEADYALRKMNHVWEDGGAYALLGPSGCGKTTLLNIISGLLTPSEGRVLFNGEDVTALEPQARNIAQVFQFPVIYDTMTVADNLAFPLRNRGMDESAVKNRVAEIGELLELTPDLNKRARGLTADAKQKISLGRGLGALRRRRHPVRRTAHRDRPAGEVSASAKAKGDPRGVRAHPGLRHP